MLVRLGILAPSSSISAKSRREESCGGGILIKSKLLGTRVACCRDQERSAPNKLQSQPKNIIEPLKGWVLKCKENNEDHNDESNTSDEWILDIACGRFICLLTTRLIYVIESKLKI